MAALAVLLTAVLSFLLSNSAASGRQNVTDIGHVAAPRVATSADLAFALSDMDTQLANLLLAGNSPEFASNYQQARDLYDQRRQQVNSDLQLIAGVSGSDPSALEAVRSILDQLGRYQASASAAALLNSTEGNPAGEPSKTVLDLYQPATALMNEILVTVHNLTTAEHEDLKRAHAAHHAALLSARMWVAILGGALLVVLVGLQVYLRVRFRRLLNPALAVATLVAGATLVGGWVMLSAEAEQSTTAEREFDAIIALSEARAISHDANTNQSRYLVDPANANAYVTAFYERAQSVANFPDADESRYSDLVAQAVKDYQDNTGELGFGGYLGDTLKEIGARGERDAVRQVLTAYQAYQQDHDELRNLATRGDRHKAIALKLGTSSGQATYDFGQYDAALLAVINARQAAFDSAIRAGETGLNGWTDLIPTSGVVVVAVLVLIGVRPRLVEYR